MGMTRVRDPAHREEIRARIQRANEIAAQHRKLAKDAERRGE
jgi:hypothetical protein